MIVAGNPAKIIGTIENLDNKRLKNVDRVIDPGKEPFKLSDEKLKEVENKVKYGPILIKREIFLSKKYEKK